MYTSAHVKDIGNLREMALEIKKISHEERKVESPVRQPERKEASGEWQKFEIDDDIDELEPHEPKSVISRKNVRRFHYRL